jgi:phosphatidylglycerophosphate synthase
MGPLAWIPGGLYLAVALLDAVDGWAARAAGGETRLGEVLDTEVDALGLLVASLLLVSDGRAPLVFLSVGLGYYVVGAASRLRSWRGQAVGNVQPRATARLIAGCQMGFAAAALLPVFDPAATFPAAYVMTAAFGLSMGMDWLIICGLATPDGRLLPQWLAKWQTAGTRLLPLFLRTTTLISIVLFTLKPWPAEEAVFLLAGILLLGLLCLLGLAARLAAMLLSILMAFLISAGGRDALAELALAAALALMMTGAGRPRIWQPEDTLLTKKHP